MQSEGAGGAVMSARKQFASSGLLHGGADVGMVRARGVVEDVFEVEITKERQRRLDRLLVEANLRQGGHSQQRDSFEKPSRLRNFKLRGGLVRSDRKKASALHAWGNHWHLPGERS